MNEVLQKLFFIITISFVFLSGCVGYETLWDVHVDEKNKIIKESNKKIKSNPKDANAYFSRGEAYLLIEKFDKAILDFNKTIES